MKTTTEFSHLFYQHINAISVDLNDYSTGKVKYVPPFVQKNLLIKLVNHAINYFNRDKIIADVPYPCVIVGDLHGHILDLYNIIKVNGLPPETNYVFLGDVIDRGNFSLECITFIYLLKIFFPQKVFLLRGNHEFMLKDYNEMLPQITMNTLRGECEAIYHDSSLYSLFVGSFAYLPIAARIGSKIFCVHGGLNQKSLDLKKLEAVKRPIYEIDDDIEGYLWSDPREGQKVPFAKSVRGSGFWFNGSAFDEFMSINKLTLFVRGHEYAEVPKFNFGKKMVTVFSASAYNNSKDNKCNILIVNEKYNCVMKCLGILQQPERPKPGSPLKMSLGCVFRNSLNSTFDNKKIRDGVMEYQARLRIPNSVLVN